jgi:hypothetical protein
MQKERLSLYASRYAWYSKLQDAEWPEDKEFILECIQVKQLQIQYLPFLLQMEREVVMASLRACPGQEIPALHMDDREVVCTAVRWNWTSLKKVSEEFRDDEEVISSAIQNSPSALRYASNRLRSSRESMIRFTTIDGRSLEYAKGGQEKDRSIVLGAVLTTGCALRFAPLFQDDKEIALAAVRNDMAAWLDISDRLRMDRDVVMAYERKVNVMMDGLASLAWAVAFHFE